MRIRTLKPEWLEDEKLNDCSDAARVLSAGLILLADDYGRGRAGVGFLAGRVWSSHVERDAAGALKNTTGALRELASIRYVVLYEVDGQRYFEIRNWTKHQRVDKPGKPRVPERLNGPRESSRESRESSRESSRNLAPDQDHDQDLDPDRDREQDLSRAPAREDAGNGEGQPVEGSPEWAKAELAARPTLMSLATDAYAGHLLGVAINSGKVDLLGKALDEAAAKLGAKDAANCPPPQDQRASFVVGCVKNVKPEKAVDGDGQRAGDHGPRLIREAAHDMEQERQA
jgi:hypothetical protein